jgi:hypothetical protein
MAKSKKKDKPADGAQAEAVDAIRSAIERGLQVSAEGAQATRERTRELVDEIASAAGRVRQSLEDMRVLDELRRLRGEVEALAGRVAALERPGSSSSTSTSTSSSTTSAAKPAAAKPRAKSSTSRAGKPAARKKSATSAAKKSTSTRSRAKKSTGSS